MKAQGGVFKSVESSPDRVDAFSSTVGRSICPDQWMAWMDLAPPQGGCYSFPPVKFTRCLPSWPGHCALWWP